MSDITDLQTRALHVKELYAQHNAQAGVTWTPTDYMSGFVGDVGALSKLVMARRGLRRVDDLDQKLPHELADCLWSVLVLADELGIDLEAAFATTMDDLEQ